MQISGGKTSLQGQPKWKKKKKKKPQRTTCLLPIKCTPREGARGGTGCLSLEGLFTPCLWGHAHSSAQPHSLFGSFTPLMSASNGGEEKKRREGGKKPSGERRKQAEGTQKGREKAVVLGGLGLPTWTSVSRSLVLTAGQLCTGALTSVNMSYCLPTWPRGFPVSIQPLASPNRCHWVTVLCAGSCNGGLERKELFISSLGPSHRQQAASAPRHNSPGSAPKNALSSTLLLSNICLPPVRLKLATSVPLAVLTCAQRHARSLKTHSAWWHGQSSTLPISTQNHECGNLPHNKV